LARAWAGFTAVELWLPYLLSAHIEGRLAAVDRSAFAIVNVVGQRRLRGRFVLVALMALSASAVVGAGAVLMIGAAVVVVLAGKPQAAVYVTWIGFLPIVMMVVHLVQMARASREASGGRLGWKREYQGHVLITCLAAWPHGQGHASRLERSLGPALARDGRPLVAGARTNQLAQVYRRWADQYPGAQFILVQDCDVARGPRRSREDRRVAG
jgi:hypothetical protein